MTEYHVVTKGRLRAAMFIMCGAGFAWGLVVGAIIWR